MREPEPPKGAGAVEWLLNTTLPDPSVETAREVLKLYGLRWRVEDWHRILKTGCDVEKIAHRTAERIKRAVSINAFIAYRLATLTLLERETPGPFAERCSQRMKSVCCPNSPSQVDLITLGRAQKTDHRSRLEMPFV